MINVYTDGGYSSSRDQGGWCFVILPCEVIGKITRYGGLMNTTNNRMEIMGIIKALEYLKDNISGEEITVFTDSMYVIGTMTKNWKMKKNTDLWPIMFELVANQCTHFEHVKGHASNEFNNECDRWAVFATQVGGYALDIREEEK